MGIRVRRATTGDLDLVAWAMLAAGRSHLDRGIWEYLHQLDEAGSLAFLRRVATTDSVHLFHHSLFLVAELDGVPAAAMCAYDLGTQGFSTFRAEMRELARESGVDVDSDAYGARFDVLVSGMVRDHDGPPGPRWVIENVATLPHARRQGLVDALLHQVLATGRERGYEHAQIGCYLGNERAKRAYEKNGFEVVAEQRSAGWASEIGCEGTQLLLQPLG